jgi:glyoxylase-like metal-dependent hydrolase (beta-lactamase superfamily II)
MREISDGILTWAWRSERHGYDFIAPSDEDLAWLAREGVAHILITNRNHTRAANAVRARTGGRTAIHDADAAYAREQGAEIDGGLRVGVPIGPLIVVAVPGKSPGEVALHWPERELLIVGDALIGNPPGACSLLPDRVMDDPTMLRASVRGLLDLDFDTLLVGDGESILGGAKDRVRQLAATFR